MWTKMTNCVQMSECQRLGLLLTQQKKSASWSGFLHLHVGGTGTHRSPQLGDLCICGCCDGAVGRVRLSLLLAVPNWVLPLVEAVLCHYRRHCKPVKHSRNRMLRCPQSSSGPSSHWTQPFGNKILVFLRIFSHLFLVLAAFFYMPNVLLNWMNAVITDLESLLHNSLI